MKTIRQLIMAMVILSASPVFATTYLYDDLNRLTEINYGNGQVVRYVYDATGNRTGSQSESCKISGDLNGDCVVDKKDVNMVAANVNKPVGGCPACDIDKDGKITLGDVRKLVLMCSCPNCVCP